MSDLWLVAGAVLLVNLPFGFWRGGLRKFTLPWFVAIHAPVPIVYGLRIWTGVPLQLISFLILVSAFFAGQFLGTRLRQHWNSHNQTSE